MKRITASIICLALCLCLVPGAGAVAQESPTQSDDLREDYMANMIVYASSGNISAGNAAAAARNSKIELMGLSYPLIDFGELYLLAKIIHAEAGSNWLSDEWKMSVGEVVLNRVASPEFPNSIAEVIYQRGQYYGVSNSWFSNLRPDERCVRIALKLLEGERILRDASVVFQANFRQGSSVHTAFYDKYLGWTYFCRSSRPGLYTEVFSV